MMKSKKPPAAQNTYEKKWVAPNQRQLFEAVASVPYVDRYNIQPERLTPELLALQEKADQAKIELDHFEAHDPTYAKLRKAHVQAKHKWETECDKFRSDVAREKNRLENKIRLYGPTKAVIAAVRKFVERFLK
jgi:hypothetical protein